MRLQAQIAFKHLLARKRQSIVSLMGIVLGVAFFLAISSLMQGSEKDFIKRLVDNSPHITIHDEYRNPRPQPVAQAYPDSTVLMERVKPVTETRGIRGYKQVMEALGARGGILASPVLVGNALINYAGRDMGVAINGMIAQDIRGVTTIENYMVEGSIDELIANPDGIALGAEMVRLLSLNLGDTITISATRTGSEPIVRTFKLLAIFRTGRADYDKSQAFANLKRVQALLDRPNRVNSIIMKLEAPLAARDVAAQLEQQFGYKAVSWQEVSEDIISTLAIRNIIMYTVVSAVLVVAAFGIYNVISTVVMEKQRDISILRSMGFETREIKTIFIIQGFVLGVVGCLLGIPLGCGLMLLLMQVRLKPPGGTETVNLPLDWSMTQFAIAALFALAAAVVAALLPARKAARVQPVDVLRGS